MPVNDHSCTVSEPSSASELPAARVTVNGTRIPVINDGVRTELRTGEAVGDGYVTRHSEVYFPAVWPLDDASDAVKYKDLVEPLNPDASETPDTASYAGGNMYVPATIKIQIHGTNKYVPVHRGFVMGVGGGAAGEVEHRMTVGDPGQLLNAIPMPSRSYEDGTELVVILEDVIDVFRDAVGNVFESITLGELRETDSSTVDITGPEDGAATLVEEAGDVAEASVNPLNPLPVDTDLPGSGGFIDNVLLIDEGSDFVANGIRTQFASQKQFSAAEHSLADALRWVQERVDGYFEFRPDPSTDTGIVLTHNTYASNRVFSARHVTDGDSGIGVFSNNALYELQPYNTVRVIGSEEDGEYVVAVASVDALVDAAGGENWSPNAIHVDASSVEEVEAKARQKLVDVLRTDSLGTIVTLPDPRVEPYTTFRSRSGCSGVSNDAAALPVLPWEVKSVVHSVSAVEQDNGPPVETELKVSVGFNANDISVVSSTEKTEDSADFGPKLERLNDTNLGSP